MAISILARKIGLSFHGKLGFLRIVVRVRIGGFSECLTTNGLERAKGQRWLPGGRSTTVPHLAS